MNWLTGILSSSSGPTPRPQLDSNRQSTVRGLYVVGDLAGAPVIKLAMDQAVEVVDLIAKDIASEKVVVGARSLMYW